MDLQSKNIVISHTNEYTVLGLVLSNLHPDHTFENLRSIERMAKYRLKAAFKVMKPNTYYLTY